MASWFAGGINRVNNTALAWQNANLFASIVGGATTANFSASLLTLDQFVGAGSINPGLTLMSDAKNLAIPGGARPVPVWTNGELRFILDQQTVWTAPSSGQNFAGAIIHEGNDTDPASSYLWFWEPSVAPQQQTAGGDVVWGAASGNLVLTLAAQYITPLGKPTKGTAENVRKLANDWDAANTRVGFALCRNDVYTAGSNQGLNYEYVQDALNDGQLFVTNCGPNEANCPEATQAQRLAFSLVGTVAQYRMDPAFQVQYSSTDPGWPVGQNMAAVLVYIYDGGSAYNAATARIMSYDLLSPVFQTAAGQNVIYGANTNIVSEINIV